MEGPALRKESRSRKVDKCGPVWGHNKHDHFLSQKNQMCHFVSGSIGVFFAEWQSRLEVGMKP